MLYPASHRLRRGRFSEPGRLYLVTTVTHRRAPLFQQFKAARTVIRHVQTRPGEFDTLAWVLMPDHLHWLLQLESAGLAHVVHGFKSCSSAALIKAGLACGQVWQAGYHDRALRRWDDVRTAARYIVANPLRAGLVDRVGAYPHWDAVWL
ncbi:REP-associated tyrosine transposase [Pseudomonas monteilii]|uniref:REP-associated tyrosine transposase n=1 Tax=Pseudomonas alabamensis TaxID=3064349 RepID=UPI00271447DB|nr:transposase [Pseudomonas sp. 22-AL-CL-001]MDO7910205.1 transposase [Pseudomonas sp. 22-AL-CL-001]